MILEKLHLIITIIAAITVTIVCLINSFPLDYSVLCILTVIVVFFIVGYIVKLIFIKKVFLDNSADNDDQTEESPPVEQSDNADGNAESDDEFDY